MNKNLPIFAKKDDIVTSVKNYDVTIIAAETGSGKSTQVPQYLYEAGYGVIVTEPRRIACVSLASRVAEESMQPQTVAYHTAFESTRTKNTEILFCTDGIQMAKLSKQTGRNDILIVDEIHEWNLNVETIVAWTKHLLKEKEQIKIVLMSATIDTKQLEEYFGEVCSVNVIDVPNKNFEVKWHFWDFESQLYDEAITAAIRGKNVLFFQPGKKEINEAITMLNDRAKFLNLDIKILPMHGEMDVSEQKDAFKHYDVPKIVVATNIAQTSITIDDIDVVIDTGVEKIVSVVNGIEGLYLNEISKADCKQRAGRAGRTKNGEYHLLSKTDFDERIEYAKPEIQRLILDKVVLKLISMGLDPENLEFFHKPKKEDIIAAKRSLRMMNAINRYGQITETGKKIIKMPVNCKCARMLIEAEKLNVVADVLTIIAIIESGSMVNFKRNIRAEFYGQEELRPAKYSDFTIENRSDLLAELDIYNMIENRKITNLKEAGINSKNFFKAKAVRQKLAYSISDTIDPDKSTGNVYNIIRALFSGMIENLCAVDGFGWLGDAATNINDERLKISKTSCVKSRMFVFGFPIEIEYKGKYNITNHIKILQFVTDVSPDIIKEYVRPVMIKTEYVKNSISFNPIENAFYATRYQKFGGIVIDDAEVTVRKDEDPDEYAVIKEIWDNIPADTKKETYVQVGSFYKKIDGYYDQYVSLTEEELQQVPDDVDTIKANNKFVIFECEHESNRSLKRLKQAVSIKSKEQKLKEFKQTLPNKTGKLETIVAWFDKLGSTQIETFDTTLTLFTGLARDKGSVFIGTFDRQEDADASTKEVLEFLIMREVNQKYQDKKFKIKTADGQKIETKASKKAKEEFHENVRMVISEVNTNTFSESLEYLKDVFDEIQENLSNIN